MYRSSGGKLPLCSKGIGDRAFGRYGVATVVMQILLMFDGFDTNGGTELTLVDVNIDIQEGDMSPIPLLPGGSASAPIPKTYTPTIAT